jgi:hypothetical protein
MLGGPIGCADVVVAVASPLMAAFEACASIARVGWRAERAGA